ncbi:MAG: radical SAM protein [Candidatus Zixiibacteriota bacterium]
MRSEQPEMVGWEITRQCNLTCPHCYTAATRRPMPDLSTPECKAIIDDLATMGTRSIGWTGGEPLLRADLEEIVAYGKAKGNFRQGVTTNGVLLDESRARSLKAAGITYIQISLDGSNPEQNMIMRRMTEDEFNKIIEAVRICKRLELTLDLAMLLGRDTIDDAWEFIKLARREGVSHIRYCGFVPWGRGKQKDVVERLLFREDRDKLRQFVLDAADIKDPIQMFDPAFGPLPPNYEFHDCIAGKQMLYISSTGEVYPCTSLLDKQFCVGNLHHRSIRELWNDPKMTEMSEFPFENIHGTCRSCETFPVCHGGCRGITYAHTRDLLASFPMCLKQA